MLRRQEGPILRRPLLTVARDGLPDAGRVPGARFRTVAFLLRY